MEASIFKMAANVQEEKEKLKPTMEMKRRAVNYYNKNNVPKCLESLLNTMFLEEPEDIYGYMAEYFTKKSKLPSIIKVEYQDRMSCRGYNTFDASVSCKINGLKKHVMDFASFFDDGPKVETPRTKSKPATGSKAKADKKVAAAPVVTQTEIPKPSLFDYEETKADIYEVSEILSGKTMGRQQEFDLFIRSALDLLREKRVKEEPKDESTETQAEAEIAIKPCNDCQSKAKIDYSELFLSILGAKLTSKLNNYAFYKILYQDFNEKESSDISLPSAMMQVMKCGTESSGKLNMFRGIYLVPKLQTSFTEGLQVISSVYRELGNILHQKLGVNGRLMNNDGSFSPSLERPEQVFEFLQNTFAALNMEMEANVDIILDIGASYFYDEEKKKYEISTANFRTSEDLLLMYSEFIEKFPVLGIIDGMSHKDLDGCLALTKQLSGRCFSFGDSLFVENADLIEEHIENQTCSGAVVRLGNYSSNLTESSKLTSLIRESGSGLIMPVTTAQGSSSEIVTDIAIAFEADFIALGAPQHNENIAVCNRLVQIENELKANNQYIQRESYCFPEYKEQIVGVENKENDQNEPNM